MNGGREERGGGGVCSRAVEKRREVWGGGGCTSNSSIRSQIDDLQQFSNTVHTRVAEGFCSGRSCEKELIWVRFPESSSNKISSAINNRDKLVAG